MIWPWDMTTWAATLLATLNTSAGTVPAAEAKASPAAYSAATAPGAQPASVSGRTALRVPAAKPAPAPAARPKGKNRPAAKAERKAPPKTVPAKAPAPPAAPTLRPAPRPPVATARPMADPAGPIVLDEIKRTPTVLGWRGEGGTGAHYETGTPLAIKLGVGATGDGGVTNHRPVWRAAPGYHESAYLLTGRAVWRY
jgi:hypothetical protein